MAEILQMIFSDAFSRKKLFQLKFNGNVCEKVQLTRVNIGAGSGLTPTRGLVIIWTNDDSVPWRENNVSHAEWVNKLWTDSQTPYVSLMSVSCSLDTHIYANELYHNTIKPLI